MLRTSNQFGQCPYDGLWLHSDQLPSQEFIRANGRRGIHVTNRNLALLGRQGRVWRHFVSLSMGGLSGALKVMWDPIMRFEGMPMARVYFNPSTTGYSAKDTLRVLATVFDDPLQTRLVQLDTKVDVEGTYWQVASHLYMPYVRYADNWEFPGTVYEGKRTKLTVYQKSGADRQSDDGDLEEPLITRVEVRQRFNRKKRPTLLQFLRGDRVAANLTKRIKVVEDLEHLGDRVLAEEALKLGLTKALREYPAFARVTIGDLRRMRRQIGRISTHEIYDHYLVSAAAWHDDNIRG